MEELLNYDGLIYSIIGKYTSKYDKDDLYQVGMIGLIDAYRHYDKNQDTKFSSFAYYYIMGEVNKYLRESSTLKVSRSFIELKKKINQAKEVMEQKLGRNPTNLEISLYLDIDVDLIDMAILSTEELQCIEEVNDCPKCYDETSPTLLDLREEISKLSEDERRLLKARYYDEYTQMETSQMLGMSQVQVSRNEAKILQKLKTRL